MSTLDLKLHRDHVFTFIRICLKHSYYISFLLCTLLYPSVSWSLAEDMVYCRHSVDVEQVNICLIPKHLLFPFFCVTCLFGILNSILALWYSWGLHPKTLLNIFFNQIAVQEVCISGNSPQEECTMRQHITVFKNFFSQIKLHVTLLFSFEK